MYSVVGLVIHVYVMTNIVKSISWHILACPISHAKESWRLGQMVVKLKRRNGGVSR